MIEVESLTKRYGTTTAISDVSFTVQKGEVVGFLGPNGAGKSTTLRVIAGSLGASHGHARVAGFDVAENPRAVLAILGYSPEVPPVYTNMNVRDYVRFAATLKGVESVNKAADHAMDRVGLLGIQNKIIDHLSKGQRQRVGLAQALVHDPKVLVLDEPTSGLDPAQRVEIRELIRELAAGDRTVILSTHVLGEIEAICSRVIIINRGRIVAQDQLDHLSGVGRVVRVEVARPGEGLAKALEAIPSVIGVELHDGSYTVRADTDVREAVASVAAPFGLHEMVGRERLEDIYLRLISSGGAA